MILIKIGWIKTLHWVVLLAPGVIKEATRGAIIAHWEITNGSANQRAPSPYSGVRRYLPAFPFLHPSGWKWVGLMFLFRKRVSSRCVFVGQVCGPRCVKRGARQHVGTHTVTCVACAKPPGNQSLKCRALYHNTRYEWQYMKLNQTPPFEADWTCADDAIWCKNYASCGFFFFSFLVLVLHFPFLLLHFWIKFKFDNNNKSPKKSRAILGPKWLWMMVTVGSIWFKVYFQYMSVNMIWEMFVNSRYKRLKKGLKEDVFLL